METLLGRVVWAWFTGCTAAFVIATALDMARIDPNTIPKGQSSKHVVTLIGSLFVLFVLLSYGLNP